MDASAMIDACRARGDHRRDPVRFRFIEALARRAATHHGETRRILDARLRELLAAYADEHSAEIPAAEGTAGAGQKAKAARGPLAELAGAATGGGRFGRRWRTRLVFFFLSRIEDAQLFPQHLVQAQCRSAADPDPRSRAGECGPAQLAPAGASRTRADA
jgi:hypothetical protein